MPVCFESGRSMESIVTYHFSNYNLKRTNNSLKHCYFSKEYGFTCREAWSHKQKCLDQGGDLSRCDSREIDNIETDY